MSALGDLVQGRLRELGWSYAELARRSGLPRSTVHFLATRERLRRVPEPSTVDALARALGVPVPAVQQAAAAAAGISIYRESGQDPEVQMLIASLSRLTPEDRQHVAALVESLLRQHDGQPG